MRDCLQSFQQQSGCSVLLVSADLSMRMQGVCMQCMKGILCNDGCCRRSNGLAGLQGLGWSRAVMLQVCGGIGVCV